MSVSHTDNPIFSGDAVVKPLTNAGFGTLNFQPTFAAAPAPANGNILVYHAASGTWRPTIPASGGATILNDLTDVNHAASNGEMLHYDQTAGEWKHAPEISVNPTSRNINIVNSATTGASVSIVSNNTASLSSTGSDVSLTSAFDVIADTPAGLTRTAETGPAYAAKVTADATKRAFTNRQYVDDSIAAIPADSTKITKFGDDDGPGPVVLGNNNASGGTIVRAGNADTFFISPNQTLSVNAGVNYETLMGNDDHIPNKKYVDDKIAADVATKVSKAGDTMTGDLVMGANKVTSTAAPTVADDLTRKGYVDSAYTTSNSGAGAQLSLPKVGTNFPFRSITTPAGGILSTTQNAADVQIAANPLAFGSAVGYYDVVQLTAAFPATFSAGHPAYPPVGGHQPGRIYINTTEKVLFISNHQRPLADLQPLPTASGEGTNALASIIAQIAGNGGAIPLTNIYENGPPTFKFYGSKPTENYETPAREICFRVNWNNGVADAVGMPSQTQNTNSSAEYGGFAAGNDSNWTWLRYGLSNFEIDLYDGDILTTYSRWWFRPGYIDSWHDLKFLDDARDVGLTTPINRQILVYNSTVSKWVNHTPPYLHAYFDANATASGTGGQDNYHWMQGTIISTAISGFSINANNALTYTATAVSPKLFEVSFTCTPVVGSNNRTIYVVAAKNKAITPVQNVAPPGTITDYIPGSRTTAICRSAVDDTVTVSGRFTVSLATSDFVRFFVANVENNDAVTISDFRICIKEVGY